MNKRGIWVMKFTVIILFAYLLSASALKERALGGGYLKEFGNVPNSAISLLYEQEKMELFLSNLVEFSAYNSLNAMGSKGGRMDKEGCDVIQGLAVWSGGCFFDTDLENVFFENFEENVKNVLDERNLNLEISSGTDPEGFFVSLDGKVNLESGNVNSVFNPGIVYYPNYEFGDYFSVLDRAVKCVEKEKHTAEIYKNELLEECEKDKEFNFEIMPFEDYYLFNVSKPYSSLGWVTISFALPKS